MRYFWIKEQDLNEVIRLLQPHYPVMAHALEQLKSDMEVTSARANVLRCTPTKDYAEITLGERSVSFQAGDWVLSKAFGDPEEASTLFHELIEHIKKAMAGVR
jgi:hypothetical protein